MLIELKILRDVRIKNIFRVGKWNYRVLGRIYEWEIAWEVLYLTKFKKLQHSLADLGVGLRGLQPPFSQKILQKKGHYRPYLGLQSPLSELNGGQK